jgi:hypothetical protein
VRRLAAGVLAEAGRAALQHEPLAAPLALLTSRLWNEGGYVGLKVQVVLDVVYEPVDVAFDPL